MGKIKWLILNTAYAASVYYGLFKGIEEALNVAIFFSWLYVLVAFALMSDTAKIQLKNRKRSIPSFVNVIFDICIISAFCWFGYVVLSVFLLIALLLTEAAWKEAGK